MKAIKLIFLMVVLISLNSCKKDDLKPSNDEIQQPIHSTYNLLYKEDFNNKNNAVDNLNPLYLISTTNNIKNYGLNMNKKLCTITLPVYKDLDTTKNLHIKMRFLFNENNGSGFEPIFENFINNKWMSINNNLQNYMLNGTISLMTILFYVSIKDESGFYISDIKFNKKAYKYINTYVMRNHNKYYSNTIPSTDYNIIIDYIELYEE